jgi:hypothetical protein
MSPSPVLTLTRSGHRAWIFSLACHPDPIQWGLITD